MYDVNTYKQTYIYILYIYTRYNIYIYMQLYIIYYNIYNCICIMQYTYIHFFIYIYKYICRQQTIYICIYIYSNMLSENRLRTKATNMALNPLNLPISRVGSIYLQSDGAALRNGILNQHRPCAILWNGNLRLPLPKVSPQQQEYVSNYE